MLIWYLRDLLDNPPALLAALAAFCLVIATSLPFHEFSHAWTAHELGDDTAARQGRLTLNPLKHLEPMGTAMILLVGFGFAKPTPVSPYRLRFGPRRGHAIVAAAGPASNFVFAAILALPLRLGLPSIDNFNKIADASGAEIVGLFLLFAVSLNVLLGIFNLIPIPPLDGFSVLQGVLPARYAQQLQPLAQWGPGILMTLLVVGFVTPFNPIGELISGLQAFVLKVVV